MNLLKGRNEMTFLCFENVKQARPKAIFWIEIENLTEIEAKV